jgi:hypothetical protein
MQNIRLNRIFCTGLECSLLPEALEANHMMADYFVKQLGK